MPSRPFAAATVAAFAAVAVLASAAPSQPPAEVNELAWAEDIVLRPGVLVGAAKTPTQRWGQSPAVSVVNGTKAQQKLVAEVAKDYAAALKGTLVPEIRLLPPNDRAATLVVQFLPKSRIPARAGELGATAAEVKALVREKAPYATHWTSSPTNPNEILTAVILAPSDASAAKELEGTLARSFAQSLGFVNGSRRQPASVFYADEEGFSGPVTKLSDADRRLVRWYYSHVPPGTTDIGPLFEKHWPKAK